MVVYYFADLSHDYMTLLTMVNDLKSILDPLREDAKDKDSRISELVKSTSVILSVWDSETEEMITNLHKTRDEQVSLYTDPIRWSKLNHVLYVYVITVWPKIDLFCLERRFD